MTSMCLWYLMTLSMRQRTGREVALLLDHAAADAHFGASVFWLRRPAAFGGEQATIKSWQTKRDGGQRGIVEFLESDNDR